MKFYDKNAKENIDDENIELNNEDKEILQQDQCNQNEEQIKESEEAKLEKEKKIRNNKILIISFVSIIILLVIMFLCSIFALLNINNNKIIDGITIEQINVGQLTKEEAQQKIKEEMEKRLTADINIKFNDFQYSIKLSQIQLEYKIDAAIEKAYSVGRSKNIFIDNYNILNAKIKRNNIDLEYLYNEELLNGIIEEISVKIPGAVIEPNYYIENEKLYISKGTTGNTIEKEKLKNEILERIRNGKSEEIILEVYQVEPKDINIDEIYNEVHKEKQNAYYTKEPFEIFPHVNGVDFDIEAAKELIKEDKEEYEILLIITEPEITTNKIGTEAFPDLLSSFSTKYDASNIPRTTNLNLAMKKLDGVVVNPGETFSYNETLGKRTAEAGYKQAGGYAGGRVVQTLAGGICQISSTLYDAAIYANLDIVERHNHMFLAGYVGAGKDATVVYGAYDLKFKNTRKYPIMIKTSIGSGVAKISIFGIKEEVEYEVEISTKILSYSSYKVIYENDSSLAEGKEKVVQNGMNGCKSITYKILRLNGQQVSSTVLSTDTYDPMNKIIKRGTTKTVETTITPQEQIENQPTEQGTPETPVVPEEIAPPIENEVPEITNENTENNNILN